MRLIKSITNLAEVDEAMGSCGTQPDEAMSVAGADSDKRCMSLSLEKHRMIVTLKGDMSFVTSLFQKFIAVGRAQY